MPIATARSEWRGAVSGTVVVTPQAWHATRAQTSLVTQVVRDADDYLASDRADIGRQTGLNERELFVSCDAPLALQQLLEHARPEFIVVHDIGTSASRKLLKGIAAASGRSIQKLVIRRQGYGKALATLFYVELPASNGQSFRMYTTKADTDSATRDGLARVLLAFSRLGVVMVGDISAELLEPELNTLRGQIFEGPWHNRDLLILPLASPSQVFARGQDLAAATGVNVRTTPLVTRPAEAWGFITDTWKRVNTWDTPESDHSPMEPEGVPTVPAFGHDSALSPGAMRASTSMPWSGSSFAPASSSFATSASDFHASGPQSVTGGAERGAASPSGISTRGAGLDLAEPPISHPAPASRAAALSPAQPKVEDRPAASLRAAELRAAAPTLSMGLEHAPRSDPAAKSPVAEPGMLQRYVRLLSALAGMRHCCVFHATSGRRVVHSGPVADAEELARQGQVLLSTMLASSAALGCGDALPEAAVTLATHHLLLRQVPKYPGLALHAVFDKATANITQARLQVMRLDALFEDTPRGA